MARAPHSPRQHPALRPGVSEHVAKQHGEPRTPREGNGACCAHFTDGKTEEQQPVDRLGVPRSRGGLGASSRGNLPQATVPTCPLGRAAPSCPPLLCPQILAVLPSCCREGAGNSPTLPQRVEGKLAGNKLRPKGQPALVISSPQCSMPAALGMKAGLCYTSPFLKSPGRLFGVPCMGPARQQAPSPLTLLLQAPPMRTPSSLSTSQLSAKEAPQ